MSVPDSRRSPSGIRLPAWATLLAAVLTALGGGAGGVGIDRATRPSSASSDQLDDLAREQRRQGSDIREIRDHLRRSSSIEAERWDLTSAVLCKLNGKPFARGVDCSAVTFEARPLDAPAIQTPGHKALGEWPFAPKPP